MKLSEVLSSKEKWTQGCFARTCDNEDRWNPKAPDACKWCLVGGLGFVDLEDDEHYKKMRDAIKKVVPNWQDFLIDGELSIALVNDTVDYPTVVRIIQEFENNDQENA
jgi:hypothetical protein